MGAGLSSEQFEAHLNRQQDLIKRLDIAIQNSAQRLQSAGSIAIDYTVDGDGYPEEENEDARHLIANLYKKSRDVNSLPNAEPPLSDEELAHLQDKPRVISSYDPDAVTFKPWLKALVEPQNTQAVIDNSAPYPTSGAAPRSPQLSRAIGFSGSMIRCASWVDNNTVVYAIGGVVVVEVIAAATTTTASRGHQLQQQQQRFFTEHGSSVTAIAVHPGRRIVASAELGFLPVINIWNVDTLETITTIADQFRTGLVALKFSADGGKLGAVDTSDDHLLGVYDCETGSIVASAQQYGDIFDLAFVEAEHMSKSDGGDGGDRCDLRIVTVGDRAITFWNTGEGDEKLIGSPAQLGNAGKKQAFTACCVSGPNLVVGTQAGELYVFQHQKLLRILDVQTRMVTCLVASWSSANSSLMVTCAGYDGVVSTWNTSSFRKVCTHNSFYENSTRAPIYSLDVSPDGSRILVGDRNNTLTVISSSSSSATHDGGQSGGQSRFVLQGGDGAHVGDQISSFAVHPFSKRFVTGGADYQVVEWDVEHLLPLGDDSQPKPKQQSATSFASTKNPAILRTHRIPAHATCCAYSPDGSLLAVGLSNGTICIFSGDDLAHSFSLGKRRVQACRFASGSGRLLAAGTADNVVEVFDVVGGFARVAQLGPLGGVVINIDFAVNDNVLRVCTQAYELVFFDIQKRQRIDDVAGATRSLLWSTCTSLFGWEVQGIWRLDSEFNDVNAVSRSHNKKWLATAETSGTVKLFKFPCVGGGLDENGVLQRRPDSNRLKGHVSNVLGVEWFGGDGYIVSASPDCVLVWKL